MKRATKTSLIIISLVLFACLAWLVWLGLRPDELDDTVAENISDTSGGPSFEVRVVVPRAGLPLGGILPDWFVEKHDLTPRVLRFDHTNRGAQISNVGRNHLELRAEGGWELLIEVDGQGQVVPGTHLVFPLGLGGRRLKLRCRPADPGVGHLNTTTREGSDEIGGRFVIELATCENAESGKAIEWPPRPLTVRGSFAGLPQQRR